MKRSAEMKTPGKTMSRSLVLCIIAFSAVLNLLGGNVALLLRLPVYLDSFGTMFTAVLLGPAAGMVPGIISGVIPVEAPPSRGGDQSARHNRQLPDHCPGIRGNHFLRFHCTGTAVSHCRNSADRKCFSCSVSDRLSGPCDRAQRCNGNASGILSCVSAKIKISV